MTHAVPHVVLRVILPLGQKEKIMNTTTATVTITNTTIVNPTVALYLCNALSLNMLSDLTGRLVHEEVTLSQARTLAHGATSAVGHADTACVLGNVLGGIVPTNRITVSLKKGDRVLVGQYVGPRLQEGATVLPEGAVIKWILVQIR